MRGFHNHHYMRAADADFVSIGTTREAYPMLISGIPYLLPFGGRGHRVDGELFRVPTGAMSILDSLESHPHWYKRDKVVIVDHKERHRYAWVYFLSSRNIPKNWAKKPMYSKFTY